MHPLLARQLKRHMSGGAPAEWTALLAAIDAAYQTADDDRHMLERSLDLSSRELMRTNSELRALLLAMPDRFFRLDRYGRILDCRGGRPEDFRSPPEALLGARIQDVPDVAASAALQEGLANAMASRRPAVVEHSRADGDQTIWYEARLLPVLEDQLVAIVRNVTERRELERALHERTKRVLLHQTALHELTTAPHDSLASALEQVTSTAAGILGVERVVVWLMSDTGKELSCEHLWQRGGTAAGSPPVVRTEVSAPYLAAVRAGRCVAAHDARNDPRTATRMSPSLPPLDATSVLDVGVRREGRLLGIVCHEHVGAPRTWSSEEQGFAIAVADLVALRLAADEHERLENLLHHSQKLEAIGKLAGGVAHDFNNILTAIIGYSELLATRFDAADRGTRDVEQILLAAERASRMTGQLLAFSRKQVLRPTLLDPAAVVQATVPMLTRLIGADIELRTIVEGTPDRVEVDRGQLEQVLLNLVVNARDAMPNGGRLDIFLSDVEIDEAAARRLPGLIPGRHILLEVSDDGGGMDETTRAQIFEPFFTTKELGRGTGLGLATVYGIIRQSGGQIEVESAPGAGATFRVYLPRADRAVTEEPTQSVPAPARGHEVILVVDDEPQIAEFAHRALESQGYTVLSAADPLLAIELAAAHPGTIDLLLTDVVMPQLNGQALAAKLAETRKLAVLFMSGYAEGAIANQGILAPGTELIRKPFNIAALTARVREVLDKRASLAAG